MAEGSMGSVEFSFMMVAQAVISLDATLHLGVTKGTGF